MGSWQVPGYFNKISGVLNPSCKTALEQFRQSANIDYKEWHNGSGCDLNMNDELGQKDLKKVELMIFSGNGQDWRDPKLLTVF